jgi:hypothetical protein
MEESPASPYPNGLPLPPYDDPFEPQMKESSPSPYSDGLPLPMETEKAYKRLLEDSPPPDSNKRRKLTHTPAPAPHNPFDPYHALIKLEPNPSPEP